jgi:hypothetical protein
VAGPQAAKAPSPMATSASSTVVPSAAMAVATRMRLAESAPIGQPPGPQLQKPHSAMLVRAEPCKWRPMLRHLPRQIRTHHRPCSRTLHAHTHTYLTPPPDPHAL